MPNTTMAIGDDSREIPDSEDEPMTSSPVVPASVSDGPIDKLSATASGPHQAPQDAPQEADNSLQATVQPASSLSPDSVNCLDADRIIASSNVEPSRSGLDHVRSHNTEPQEGACAINSLAYNGSTTLPAEQHKLSISTNQNSEKQISDTSMNNEHIVQQSTPTFESTLSFEINRENQSRNEDHDTMQAKMNSKPLQHCGSSTCHASIPISAPESVDAIGEMSSPSDPLLSIHETSANHRQDDAIDADVKLPVATELPGEHIVEKSGVISSGKMLLHFDQTDALVKMTEHAVCAGARTQVATGTTAAPPQAHPSYVEGETILPSTLDLAEVDRQSSRNADSQSQFVVKSPVTDEPATVIACQNQDQVPRESFLDEDRVTRFRDTASSSEVAGKTSSSQGQESAEIVGGIKKPYLISDVNVLADEISDQVQLGTAPMEQTLAEQNVQPTISQTDDNSNVKRELLEDKVDSQYSQTTTATLSLELLDTQPHVQSFEQLSPALPPPTRPKTSQENTLAELKAQKSALLAALMTLPAIQVLVEEDASFKPESMDDGDEPTEFEISAAADKLVKDHIKLLHEYNELKDVGQALMGLIADQRGVRIVEIQDEFGMDTKD